MTFKEAVKTCLKKYAIFYGRASRSEFWWFMLFNFLVNFAAGFISALTGVQEITAGLLGIYNLAVLLPVLAVSCRRLHDINRTGWWLTVPGGLMFFAGLFYVYGQQTFSKALMGMGMIFSVAGLLTGIVIFIFYCMEGTTGPNKYGADPLEIDYQSDDKYDKYDEYDDIQSNITNSNF